MKCSIMLHFIWGLAICQSTRKKGFQWPFYTGVTVWFIIFPDKGFIVYEDFMKTVSSHWKEVTPEEDIIECFKVLQFLFDFLRPLNNISVIKGRFFLG